MCCSVFVYRVRPYNLAFLSKVVLKIINHLLVMMTMKTLEFFIPSNEYILKPGENLLIAKIAAIDEMGIVRFVFGSQYHVTCLFANCFAIGFLSLPSGLDYGSALLHIMTVTVKYCLCH